MATTTTTRQRLDQMQAQLGAFGARLASLENGVPPVSEEAIKSAVQAEVHAQLSLMILRKLDLTDAQRGQIETHWDQIEDILRADDDAARQ